MGGKLLPDGRVVGAAPLVVGCVADVAVACLC